MFRVGRNGNRPSAQPLARRTVGFAVLTSEVLRCLLAVREPWLLLLLRDLRGPVPRAVRPRPTVQEDCLRVLGDCPISPSFRTGAGGQSFARCAAYRPPFTSVLCCCARSRLKRRTVRSGAQVFLAPTVSLRLDPKVRRTRRVRHEVPSALRLCSGFSPWPQVSPLRPPRVSDLLPAHPRTDVHHCVRPCCAAGRLACFSLDLPSAVAFSSITCDL